MNYEQLKRVIKKIFRCFCALLLITNYACIYLAFNTIPNYEAINYNYIKSKTFQRKIKECEYFTSEFYMTVLFSHIYVLGFLFCGLISAFAGYAEFKRYLNELNRIRKPKLFNFLFGLWLILAPIYCVFYARTLKDINSCMFASKTYTPLYIHFHDMLVQTLHLIFLNAFGFLILLVSMYITLIEYCLSHIMLINQDLNNNLIVVLANLE